MTKVVRKRRIGGAKDLSADRSRGGGELSALVSRYAVVIALLGLIVGFSLLRPTTFFTTATLESVLVTETVVVVLSLGVMVALAAGEFDLSVAALLGFIAGLIAYLSGDLGWSLAPTLGVSFAAAVAVGSINAAFVVGFGVSSFITTIGMGGVLTGLAVAIYGPETIGGVSSDITEPIRSEVAGIGASVFVAFGLALILWYFLEHMPSGRHLFFTGEGREAARLAGVRVNRIRFCALIASALSAWLAALLLVGQTGAGQASYGQPYLLPAFAAAFLGATTIRPGRYNAWGTIVAVYFLGVSVTGLQLLGAEVWVDDVFSGAAVVVAVTVARLVARRAT